MRFPVQGLHSGRDLGASNLKYSKKEEENAPTAMCRKRLAKLDSQLTTHSVNEHVTLVNFLKNFSFLLRTVNNNNVQVRREKLVTCRQTHATTSPISISQKNDSS